MNDLPRDKLCELVAHHGPGLCSDVRRCEALLKEACGDHKREVLALVTALKERVPGELLAMADGLTRPTDGSAPYIASAFAAIRGPLGDPGSAASADRGHCGAEFPQPSGAEKQLKRRFGAWQSPQVVLIGGLVMVLLLIIAAGTAIQSAGTTTGPEPGFAPVGPLLTEQRFRDYVIRIYGDNSEQQSVEIRRRGRRVYALEGGRFSLGEGDGHQSVPPGTDITADGNPDLVLSEYMGGAHGDTTYRVFQVSDRFQFLYSVQTMGGSFQDVDGDANYEFVTADSTFAYWHTSYASSPFPQVILQFRRGNWSLAVELMRKPPPSPSDLSSRAAQVLGAEWGSVEDGMPSELWGYMLDLIYTGQADAAGQFFDMAWPSSRSGKAEFVREFRAQLTTGPYWTDLQRLNASSTFLTDP